MRRPVRAKDGNVYEKKALEEYIRLSETSGELLSPVTQKPMERGRFPKFSSFLGFAPPPKPLQRNPALVRESRWGCACRVCRLQSRSRAGRGDQARLNDCLDI